MLLQYELWERSDLQLSNQKRNIQQVSFLIFIKETK